MSKERSLELAIAFLAPRVTTPITADEVLGVAAKFAVYLGVSQDAQTPASKPRKTAKPDPAPTETVAVATETKDEAPAAMVASIQDKKGEVPKEAPKEAPPAVSEADVRTAIGKAAGHLKVGPMKVRAVLATCLHPDTGKPAANVTTLHASHYAKVHAELTKLVAEADAEVKAA